MRLLSLLLLAFSLGACGPDVSAWVGTWSGSATLNAGRQPEPLTGTLVVTGDGHFTLTSTPTGGANAVWTCALIAQTVTATKATFQVPASCALGVTPSDGCTYSLTINAAEVNRQGDAVDGTVSGRVSTSCPGQSNTTANFLLSFGGAR